MMQIVFASHNQYKLKEIQSMLDKSIQLLSLDDVEIFEEIPENELTFQGNAKAKVSYVIEKHHVNCFADDSGLEVDALNGEPGVYSARYAGEPKNYEANLQLVLTKLKDQTNRNACFKTCIALYLEGSYHFFEGEIRGKIIEEKRGQGGFGYDPIFIPDGSTKTFAEMTMKEKNLFSHRAKALKQMVQFLSKTNEN